MKSLLMSLTLFIPATSALAESTDYQSIIEMYHAHPEMLESQRLLPEPVYQKEFIILRLFQIQDTNQQIKTIKANLTDGQRLVEAVA